jgi:hypothetical protein
MVRAMVVRASIFRAEGRRFREIPPFSFCDLRRPGRLPGGEEANPRMSVRFGFQQKERERKERQRADRRARERDETERYEMEQSVRQRLESGDLKDTVASRVRQMLETPAVEERIQQRTSELIVAKREEALRAIEKTRAERVAAARREEEERLSEAQRLKDILEENKRKVDDEARRRAEGETRAMLERQAELRERDAAARIAAERRLGVT